MKPLLKPTASGETLRIDAWTARPFLSVTLIWTLIGVSLSMLLSDSAWTASGWFLGIALLCLVDFFAIAKLLSVVLPMASGSANSSKKAAYAIQALFWGALKLGCLGIIGLVLLNAQNAPQWPLVLGMGTLIVVPLIGGLQWSQRELDHA